MIKIDKAIKAEIEGAIGQTIPDPQSTEFETFYEWLAREQPELARKLETSLEVTEPYPEEAAQKQARRREGIANGIQRWFYKIVWGKRVLNRCALSLTIFFLIFGVMMASWSFTFFRKPSRVERVEQQEIPLVQQSVNEADVASFRSALPKETSLLVVPEVEVSNMPPAEDKTQDGKARNVTDAVPPLTLSGDSSSSRPLEVPPVPQSPSQTKEEVKVMTQTSVLAADEDESILDFKSSVKLFEAPELATQPVLINSPEPTTLEQNSVLAFTKDESAQSQSSIVTPSSASEDVPLETPSSELDDVSSEPELARTPALSFGNKTASVTSIQNAESTSQRENEETASDVPPTSLETTNSLDDAVIEQPSQTSKDEALLETDIFDGNATDLLKPGMLISAVLQKDIILT
jgi:hypothetical protein